MEDGHTKIDVKFEDESVQLTQARLCELYLTNKSNISEHIKHIFEEGELEEYLMLFIKDYQMNLLLGTERGGYCYAIWNANIS